jgi:hypothetical protein
VTSTFKDPYGDFKRQLVTNSLTELTLKVALSLLFPKKLRMKGNVTFPNFR